MIKVLVGETNAVFRRGLCEILNEQTGMQVLAEATTQVELLEKARCECPDVTVLEVSLPGKQALDMLKQLRQEFPKLPIVLMGGRASDIPIAQRAMASGASAFLSRNSSPKEIVGAIHKALRGERYIAAEMAQIIALKQLSGHKESPSDLLSDRELQVLCMIASGKRLKEIAHSLSISYNTVNTYRQRILEKMSMEHNADMIRYAIENRLVESE